MSEQPSIDPRFLRPLESMGKALEMAEVPMLIFTGPGLDDFADQTSALIGGRVIYSSQATFEAQSVASIKQSEYLFVVIDQPLSGRAYGLVHAYLAARDVMGADLEPMKTQFAVASLPTEHRLILLVEQAVFARHEPARQRTLSELATRIAVM